MKRHTFNTLKPLQITPKAKSLDNIQHIKSIVEKD
jgi:hypothetical protein